MPQFVWLNLIEVAQIALSEDRGIAGRRLRTMETRFGCRSLKLDYSYSCCCCKTPVSSPAYAPRCAPIFMQRLAVTELRAGNIEVLTNDEAIIRCCRRLAAYWRLLSPWCSPNGEAIKWTITMQAKSLHALRHCLWWCHSLKSLYVLKYSKSFKVLLSLYGF